MIKYRCVIECGDYMLSIFDDVVYISYKGQAIMITHEEMLKRLHDMNYQYPFQKS